MNTKNIKINLANATGEEMHPMISEAFPYRFRRMHFNPINGFSVEWHWHREVELFYITEGILEYQTPEGVYQFPAGTGGLVNAGILHRTKSRNAPDQTLQNIHIFQTDFLCNDKNSLFYQKYIEPVLTSGIDIYHFQGGTRNTKKILDRLQKSFHLNEDDFLYEMKLRQNLEEIFALCASAEFQPRDATPGMTKMDTNLKTMMIYVQDNYNEKIAVSDIANAAALSERECYRLFQRFVKTSPANYLKQVRLEHAKNMLAHTDLSFTDIAMQCNLGESSYFGLQIKKETGMTPTEYRKRHRS